MTLSYNLERFVLAQDQNYPRVLTELQRGDKRSHWMWYVFPQVAGLGTSADARKFAISSRAEATHYLEHPVLGGRLLECAALVLRVQGKSADHIFGATDAMKLCSSATLFAEVAPAGSLFHRILEHYFDGHHDERTLELLRERECLSTA